MNKSHSKHLLPSLNALPLFEAAAFYESFSKAAQSLHVTHGAVSRAVASLEAHLGVPLFHRRNRRVVLTPAGELLYKATRDSLAGLDEAVEKIHRHSVDSPFFTISCEPTLAMRWLMPKLGDFYRLHPELNVDVRMAGGPIDLLAAGCDVAIRRSDFGIPNDYRVTPFAEERAGPVCTQAYFDALGGHWQLGARLHSRTRPAAWKDWLAQQSQEMVFDGEQEASILDRQQDRHFDHFFYALQAAQSGLGMAIGSLPVVQKDLEEGFLIAPWGMVPTGHCYQVLSLDRMTPDPRVLALESWLIETCLEQER
ncbi:LysR family transcriptional regulator [Rhodanobacter aciditrophus]|uniref:LysR family transcriptional regulator n=1 Tax=Rhodanobacter aciditrophus TaxID=1623218 RepID=A0ABW4AYX9_9GAMM